jgi:hypothetical protein
LFFCQRAVCDCASQLREQDRIPNLGVTVRLSFNLGLSLVVAFTATFLFALALVIAHATFFLTAVLFVIPVVLPITLFIKFACATANTLRPGTEAAEKFDELLANNIVDCLD